MHSASIDILHNKASTFFPAAESRLFSADSIHASGLKPLVEAETLAARLAEHVAVPGREYAPLRPKVHRARHARLPLAVVRDRGGRDGLVIT
jgi:hypothetical protein